MPQKAHRPGLTRTHSHTRTSTSGSSSKLAANLQFTQKDAITPSKPDKHRRSSHGLHSNLARTGSAAKVSSRDNLAALSSAKLPQHRARNASDKGAATNGAGPKHKAGFTLASTVGSDDEDEDEWVSSESGAATPNKQAHASSSESEDVPVRTPQDSRQRPTPLPLPDLAKPSSKPPISPTIATTPRADSSLPHLTRQQHAPVPQQFTLPSDRGAETTPTRKDPTPSRSAPSSRIAQQPIATLSLAHPQTPPRSPSPNTHSRTQPPTPTSPRQNYRSSKRMSVTRPPSIMSEHSGVLRPHPLIRGHSHGLGASNLAPLTVSSAAAQAQLSSSPPSTPGSTAVHAFTPASPAPSSASSVSAPFRRTSISSVHSNATAPVTHSRQPPGRTHDRTRTLSAVSSASSAALSSLAQLPGRGSPRDSLSIHSYTQSVRFPPSAPASAPLHSLLPQPYVQPHLTMLAWRSPIRESFDRVFLAKTSKKRIG